MEKKVENWFDTREKNKIKSKTSVRGGVGMCEIVKGEKKSCVGAKTETEVKGSKWKDQVKIINEGKRQCSVVEERGLVKDKQQ